MMKLAFAILLILGPITASAMKPSAALELQIRPLVRAFALGVAFNSLSGGDERTFVGRSDFDFKQFEKVNRMRLYLIPEIDNLPKGYELDADPLSIINEIFSFIRKGNDAGPATFAVLDWALNYVDKNGGRDGLVRTLKDVRDMVLEKTVEKDQLKLVQTLLNLELVNLLGENRESRLADYNTFSGEVRQYIDRASIQLSHQFKSKAAEAVQCETDLMGD